MYKYFEYGKYNNGMKRVYECTFDSKPEFDKWNHATVCDGFKVYVKGNRSFAVAECVTRK